MSARCSSWPALPRPSRCTRIGSSCSSSATVVSAAGSERSLLGGVGRPRVRAPAHPHVPARDSAALSQLSVAVSASPLRRTSMFPVIVGRVRNAARRGRTGGARRRGRLPVDEGARAPHGLQPLELLERPLLRPVLAAARRADARLQAAPVRLAAGGDQRARLRDDSLVRVVIAGWGLRRLHGDELMSCAPGPGGIP